MSSSMFSFDERKVKEIPMVDIAFEILKQSKNNYQFQELVKKIATVRGMTDEEVLPYISQLFTEINIDGRFVHVGQNEWGLKSWYPVDQNDSLHFNRDDDDEDYADFEEEEETYDDSEEVDLADDEDEDEDEDIEEDEDLDEEDDLEDEEVLDETFDVVDIDEDLDVDIDEDIEDDLDTEIGVDIEDEELDGEDD